MPTLFRLLITVLFLAGLVYAGMFALVSFVEPNPKDIVQRIPTRDLLGESDAPRPGMPVPNVSAQPPARP
jgi:Tat protein secretion system quality control protein TatD with DNase activity